MNTFKQRLQVLIDQKNISQREVAEELGIDEARVSVWLSGKVALPRRTTIIKLAKLFDCDVDWLSGEESKKRSGSKIVMKIEPGPGRKPAQNAEHQKYIENQGEQNEIGEDHFKMSEMVTMTVAVLESKTVYRSALASNIRAFYDAVQGEEEMAKVREEVAAQRVEIQTLTNMVELMQKQLESLGAIIPEKKEAQGN